MLNTNYHTEINYTDEFNTFSQQLVEHKDKNISKYVKSRNHKK
jgi:hypothetical protein